MAIPRRVRRVLRNRKRAARRFALVSKGRAVSRLRVAAWTRRPWWAGAVPASVRDRLRLEPPPPGERRVEIGAGFSGRPGYVHVDIVPWTSDIDVLASGDALPFPDEWADEILSVHMIEHVRPPRLMVTLEHWYAHLRPGGTLVVHTPNGASLARALADGHDPHRFWAVMSAMYGYGHHPADMTSPNALTHVPEHTVALTSEVLRGLLADAGFVDIEDVSGEDPLCHHTRDWSPYVDALFLEVRARRPV